MKMSSYDYVLLFVFKTCIEANSFSKASKILDVKQPSISYSIKRLEDLLNVQLFERGNFGIRPTEKGKILYNYILTANNSIVSGLRIIDELNKKEISEIKVGFTLNLAVSYISSTLKEFNKLFPNVTVSITSKHEDEMINELQEKKLDVVIFNSYKENSFQEIHFKKIKQTKIVLVGNEKYKKIFDNNNRKEKVPLLLPNTKTYLGKDIFKNTQLNEGDYQSITYCQSSMIARELLLSGYGIGYINEEAIRKELGNGDLFIFSVAENLENYYIKIATQEKNINTVVQEFIKIFTKKVNE